MSILAKIQTGRIGRPQKIVIYAPEGFGKSTLAGQFPNPLFLDIEGSTSQLDVARIGRESLPTLATVEQAFAEITATKPCATLVVDTADWLEQMVVDAMIADADNKKITGIEDFGYGKGYTMLKERFTILLSRLDSVIQAGINVVLLAHSFVKKFEPPDGAGAYDRYELKLSKQVAPLVKEWADAVLFGNWRTQIREKDKNESGQQFKGVGGKDRKLFANRCATHDAKNRHGLADEEAWHIDTIKKAFTFAAAPWGNSPTPAQPAKVAAVQQPEPVKSAPIEGVKDAGEVAAKIVAELKPDEIPMHFDANGKGIVSPEEIEFHRICEPHEDAVNKYLLNSAAAAGRIQPGQTFRDVSIEYIKRVLKNPANFLKVVQSEGGK